MSARTLIQNALTEADAPAVLTAFRAAFGHDRSPAEHVWRYHANPAGRLARIAYDGDQIAAMVAALPTQGWMDGQPLILAQGTDTFVHPDHRRGLAKSGVLSQVGEAFFEDHADDVALYFGWPVQGYRRAGSRMFGFERLGRQMALVREGTRAVASSLAVHADPELDERVTWLGERCLAAWGLATLRNADWFRWRYLARPETNYSILAVGDASALEGLCVWRPVPWGDTTVACIVDWLVPPDATEVGDALLDAVDAAAHDAGIDTVALWMPAWSPWFAWFTDHGFWLTPTEAETVVRTQHPRIDLERLRDGWWYQLGDSDLV